MNLMITAIVSTAVEVWAKELFWRSEKENGSRLDSDVFEGEA